MAAVEPTIVTECVGSVDDFPEGMKAVDIAGGKALIVNYGGMLSAIGHKCPHAGAALSSVGCRERDAELTCPRVFSARGGSSAPCTEPDSMPRLVTSKRAAR